MDDLVESSLKERRIDRDDRYDPLRREARGEGDRVLLADPDVEEAVGELLEERQQSGASRHRGSDRDRALVGLKDLPDRVGEDGGVLGRDLLRRAGRGYAVPFHVVGLGRRVPVALLGLYLNEDRTVGEVAGLLEEALHREEIVAIDRAEVREAELLEEQVRDEQRLQAREDPAASLFGEVAAGHMVDELSCDVLRTAVRLGRAQRFEHPRDRA